MKTAVRYYTKSGNTKKLADSIAKALETDAKTVDTPLEEKVEVLFLGSSVYAAGIADEVKKFIVANKDKIGMIVNFSTAALLPSTYRQVKSYAEKNGVMMAEDEFHCKGSFGPMHKGKPDADDEAKAASFALDVMMKH